MLPAQHRFRGRNSLNYVYQKGQTLRGPDFSIKYILNNRCHSYRVAVVVSRKVNKSAVARNRLRRRFYAAVREFGPKISRPYDIIISIFSDELSQLPPAELSAQLSRLLARGGLIKP